MKAFDEKLAKLGYDGNSEKLKRSHHRKTQASSRAGAQEHEKPTT
jgi:hypothetical protein